MTKLFFTLILTLTMTPYYPPINLGSSYQQCFLPDGSYGAITYMGRSVEGADRATFKVLGRENETTYAKDTNYVFYEGKILERADPKTFEFLKEEYAKDAESLFYRGEKIQGADIETFAILPGSYSKDRNFVYYTSSIMLSADVETFEIINISQTDEYSDYARDKKNIYYKDKIVKNVDDKTFTVLYAPLAKDKNYVFVGGEINKLMDTNTLEMFDKDYPVYLKDKNHVYFVYQPMKNFDVKTFVNIGDGYIRDKNNIYYYGEVVKGADKETFELDVSDRGAARDQNAYYRFGKKTMDRK